MLFKKTILWCRRARQLWKGLAALSLILLLLAASPKSEAALEAGSQANFTGRATVVKANVLRLETTVSDTGPLPSSGGAAEATLLQAGVDGLLTAEVLHAATVGMEDHTRSEASAANLNLTLLGNTISAGFLMSRAAATCLDGLSVHGNSDLVDLMINGQAITVTGEPNQTIALPNGQVVINEQWTAIDNRAAFIRVVALRVIVNGLANVAISSAEAGISRCGGPPSADDFVTGGGWIDVDGCKATFGVAGGIKNGALWGHLTYIDHGSSLQVKSKAVTAYVVVDATTRRIEGPAEINGQAGYTYAVVVSDNGEPGTADSFQITLSNGYSAAGTLGGGNIQLHGG